MGVAAGACAGVVVYIVAARIAHPGHHFNAPLFPDLRAGVEEYSRVTAAGLFSVGAALGFARPKHPWIMGWSTIWLLIVAAFCEMGADPTSHNLWPLEFVCYAVEALPAIAGACLASRLRQISAK